MTLFNPPVFMKEKLGATQLLQIALEASYKSKARRLKVGAAIVSGRYLSIGYNQVPHTGFDEECEDDKLIATYPHVIHAEADALDRLTRFGIPTMDSIAFLTHAPCMPCAMRLYGADVRRVYYINSYRDDSGIKLLERVGIPTFKVDLS